MFSLIKLIAFLLLSKAKYLSVLVNDKAKVVLCNRHPLELVLRFFSATNGNKNNRKSSLSVSNGFKIHLYSFSVSNSLLFHES